MADDAVVLCFNILSQVLKVNIQLVTNKMVVEECNAFLIS